MIQSLAMMLGDKISARDARLTIYANVKGMSRTSNGSQAYFPDLKIDDAQTLYDKIIVSDLFDNISIRAYVDLLERKP